MEKENIQYTPLTIADINDFIFFTDKYIGTGYYNKLQAQKYLMIGAETSFKAKVSHSIVGIRLTLPPNQWIGLVPEKFLSLKKWTVPSNQVAYFKSLFVDDEFHHRGIASQLNDLSVARLKAQNTLAILTHCWKESPKNSSQNYLLKKGFIPLQEHINFWSNINYLCTRCKPHRCTCTAIEMIKYLEQESL